MSVFRWERLEQYLFDHEKLGSNFSVHEYADAEGMDAAEGSIDIQNYLRAQRGPKSKTLFVLRRMPKTRTRTARWAVGIKTKDARLVGDAFANDVRTKVMRAVRPDLLRLRTINPRTGKLAESQITALIDHMLPLLEMAANGMTPPGGWPEEDDE